MSSDYILSGMVEHNTTARATASKEEKPAGMPGGEETVPPLVPGDSGGGSYRRISAINGADTKKP